MRLWAWEENNDKQMKKRKLLWTAAVICWLAALAVSYWAEHSLYGGVIETGTFLFLGGSIGMPIGFCLRWWLGIEDKPLTKKGKWAIGVLLALSLAVLVWSAVRRGEAVYMIQLLFILPVLHWSDREKTKDIDRNAMHACTLLFSAVMLIAGTLAGPKLTGIHTVKQAEKTIAAEGFSDVSYVRWMYGKWLDVAIEESSFYHEEMRQERFYLFAGEKDGEHWRIVIDPKGSEGIFAAAEKDEPKLANWI